MYLRPTNIPLKNHPEKWLQVMPLIVSALCLKVGRTELKPLLATIRPTATWKKASYDRH